MKSPTPVFKGAKRIKTIVVFALFCCLLIGGWVKASLLQLGNGKALAALSNKQTLRTTEHGYSRGKILDRNGDVLALSVPAASIFAEPRRMKDTRKAISQLKKTFPGLSKNTTQRISSDRAFVYVARRVNPNLEADVKAQKIAGVSLYYEDRRFYPNHSLLGQTLGAVSLEGKGLWGIELGFDSYLQPQQKDVTRYKVDARGKTAAVLPGGAKNAVAGNDVMLTIDRRLQAIAENSLQKAVHEAGAIGGWALVMNVRTGELLVVANVPSTNPNKPGTAPVHTRRNTALAGVSEPGSVFKIMAFAAAFENEVANPQTVIFCEDGKFKIGKYTIKDIKPKGDLTVEEIFRYSSNIGTLKLAQLVGKEKLEKTILGFGFTKSPGLGISEEARGYLSPSKTWGDARFANVSFGYGIMASSLQVLSAGQAIANGGLRVAPRLIKAVLSPAGQELPLPQPQEPQVAISKRTATMLTELMISATNEGSTGAKARIPGILVAGKTGTTEKLDPKTKRYSKVRNRASFLGFAPADNPEIVALVVIDETKSKAYGGVVAAPVWREIVSAALAKSEL
jgi:cell division protein FtsI (penicillin-binding protein 3)